MRFPRWRNARKFGRSTTARIPSATVHRWWSNDLPDLSPGVLAEILEHGMADSHTNDDGLICSLIDDPPPWISIGQARYDRMMEIVRAAIAVEKSDQAGIQAAYENLVRVVRGAG
jgi:hypothetical protein